MIKKIITVFLVALFLSCGQKTEPKEVLFVCTHGAARSPIAAAYFNKTAEELGLNYHAIYKATEPDNTLTDETITGLTNDGFEVSNWKPELVSENDIKKAYKIVTFDCELPTGIVETAIERWDGTPPISKDYDKARNTIKEKVNRLIESLPKN